MEEEDEKVLENVVRHHDDGDDDDEKEDGGGGCNDDGIVLTSDSKTGITKESEDEKFISRETGNVKEEMKKTFGEKKEGEEAEISSVVLREEKEKKKVEAPPFSFGQNDDDNKNDEKMKKIPVRFKRNFCCSLRVFYLFFCAGSSSPFASSSSCIRLYRDMKNVERFIVIIIIIVTCGFLCVVGTRRRSKRAFIQDFSRRGIGYR